MSTINKLFKLMLAVGILSASSCNEDITDINLNPNGVNFEEGNPSFLLTEVMVKTAMDIGNKGYSDPMAAYVQYIQKDAWGDNNYDWKGGDTWANYYHNLRTAKLALKRSQELEFKFHEAVAIIMMAHNFALLTDFYGDAPYSEALQGDENLLLPKYDSQETIYKGAIADFEKASAILASNMGSLEAFAPTQDIFFGGDAEKWMRYANSLALRYYMRLSEKDPAYAGAGVQATLAKPLIASVDEECAVAYIGVSPGDSQPSNGQQGSPSEFTRVKPCTTLTDMLTQLEDPRRDIWFAPAAVQIKVVAAADVPGGGNDVVVDGIRYINEATLAGSGLKIYNPNTWIADRLAGLSLIDTSAYVGIPVAYQGSEPYTYNLNPNPVQGGPNPHVSSMNSMFANVKGEHLKARLFSYAEICFLKAEAALKGWGSDAEGNYKKGIQASLETWGIGDQYVGYIDNVGVAYNGTLAQVMEQKWIANFSSASEAYMDWRRTGFPDLKAGPFARSTVIPVRLPYPNTNSTINPDNYRAAIKNLEVTPHTDDVPGYIENDTPWSKPWVLQGVNKPW